MQTRTGGATISIVDVALRAGVVGLTLTTASIHSTLGDPLFMLNALGYVALAVAMVAPFRLFREIRWLTRLVLIGYTATTIVGWYLFGPRYNVAYIAKGVELMLIALLIVESYRNDGSPMQVARRLVDLGARFVPRHGRA